MLTPRRYYNQQLLLGPGPGLVLVLELELVLVLVLVLQLVLVLVLVLDLELVLVLVLEPVLVLPLAVVPQAVVRQQSHRRPGRSAFAGPVAVEHAGSQGMTGARVLACCRSRRTRNPCRHTPCHPRARWLHRKRIRPTRCRGMSKAYRRGARV